MPRACPSTTSAISGNQSVPPVSRSAEETERPSRRCASRVAAAARAVGFSVVAHLYSTRRKHALLLRTRVPREDPVIESVVELFPGAAWHERETYEMFGITFARHPDLKPLLLPPGFEGHPLRKEFVLASRVAKAWPGAKEPGESESGTAKRAPMRPPGVPDPSQWGPQASRDAD